MEPLPLPEQFRAFALSTERDGGITYATICRHVAEDPDVLQLIAQAPAAQRRPNLLLAAVHFLLLGGADHPLATHYDTVAVVWGRPPPPPLGDVGVEFSDFCLSHRNALLDLIAVRNTQTNEVGRCAALLPALCAIAATDPDHQPLALLDLGTSAGLNLLLDRYAYHYRQRSDGSTMEAGVDGSPVTLDCTVRGILGDLPTLKLPVISSRSGIDVDPINPGSEDGARWLLACQWPDNLTRFVRLRAAIALAAAAPDPPSLFRGDIVDRLPEVAAEVGPDTPLVVFHSWVAAYLTSERQVELVEAVRALGRTRPVHYLYAESPNETSGLPTPPSPEPDARSDLVTALVLVPADGSEPVRLADLHPHGRWVRWWSTPGVPTAHRAGPGPAPPPR